MNEVNFIKLEGTITENVDSYDNLIKKLYLSSEVIDFDVFKKRLFKEINEIDCTPTKDGATVEEIHDFFKEIDNIPGKLQRQRKQKELQRLNSTVVQKKDVKESHGIGACIANQSVPILNASYGNNSLIKNNCNLTPKEIFENFNYCKQCVKEIIKKFENDSNKMQHYNNELEKVQKFISDLNSITKDYKNLPNVNCFSEEEDEKLEGFANAFEQLHFVNENQNIFFDVRDYQNIEKLNLLMDTVNDILKNVV